MKIKIFDNDDVKELENEVNEFLKDKYVVDIRCSVTTYFKITGIAIPRNRIFVVYKDGKKC